MRATSSMEMAVLAVAFYLVAVAAEQSIDFDPKVTASCGDFPYMKILVSVGQPFNGVVHTSESRSDACKVYGNGTSNVSLRVNVLARPNDADYCGVRSDDSSGERRVALFVRYHRSLERKEDKVFSISCGNPGFQTSKNDFSKISLAFIDDGKKTQEVVKGHQYFLRIEQSKPDPSRQLKVKQCISFGQSGEERVELTDQRGCPLDAETMTRFRYDATTGTAEAIVFSMFKFPGTSAVHVNCLVAVCDGACKEEACDSNVIPQGRSIEENSSNQFWTAESAYVLEPGETGSMAMVDCTIQRWSWLLGLCIAFGVLFLIMLIVNILLCSALTCSCAKQEVVEREPSVIEDYDPYKGGWSGSQYGSRYSLNGKQNYGFGGSTPNSTTRSVSTNSDHYAIVHSQPGSRYQGGGGVDDRSSKGGFTRGPESTLSHGHQSHMGRH